MSFKKHLGEWLYISGSVLVTVMLADTFGYVKAIILGCGLSLIAGGIIRVVKDSRSK